MNTQSKVSGCIFLILVKYITIFTLFFLFIFCTYSKGQSKTNLPPDTIKLPKEGVSTHGPSTSVRIIRQDRKGNLWLASNEGVLRYDGKFFINITGNLTPARYFSLVEDKKGNFWFATNGWGAYYYDGKSFLHFSAKHGLANDQVLSMCADNAGNTWFGTIGGVSRYDGKSFQNFTTDGGVNSILQDKTGKLWFGTRGYTYVYDGKTFSVFTGNGSDFTNVWSIIEDRKGNIWFGGGHGLWRYDGSTYTNFTRNSVNVIYEDKNGNLWTCGNNDMRKFAFSRYDGKTLSNKNPTVTQITESLNLFGILEANDGTIWFGAYDGVYRYDGKTIKDFK